MLVLRYLNSELEDNKFKELAYFITDKKNNFITFNIKEKYLLDMLDRLDDELDKPPVNRKRKIIFKQLTGLNTEEKLKIVGQLVGRSKSIYEDDIYQCMLDINDLGKKITMNKIANSLKCSTRTVYRTMGNQLKQEKNQLNKII